MREGREETFHYEMDSKFSTAAHWIVQKYGDESVLKLSRMLKKGQASTEVAQEALLQLGLIEDSATHTTRLAVLEESLKSGLVGLRDAAGLGIASMDDPRALPAPHKALDRETSSRLLYDPHLVVEQLERTQQCQDS